jgi:hypothetical protein
MTTQIHTQVTSRDAEYALNPDEKLVYPQIQSLLSQKYGFLILKRCQRIQPPREYVYILACEVFCSNGTEVLHRYEPLSPIFASLNDLEGFVSQQLMNILHRHFYGRDLEIVY